MRKSLVKLKLEVLGISHKHKSVDRGKTNYRLKMNLLEMYMQLHAGSLDLWLLYKLHNAQ